MGVGHVTGEADLHCGVREFRVTQRCFSGLKSGPMEEDHSRTCFLPPHSAAGINLL
jgi:hypothetical protein